jgi:PmbA protein
VEDGVLTNYLLDTYAARKLGLHSTGSASRSFSDSPTASTTNFFLKAGSVPPEEIIRSIRSGLYVTELSGFGVNPVTGDYSRGAVGLWIENGELTYPVEEITIAGNLLDMFKNIEVIGNDLELRGTLAAPTLKITKMTIAGE